MSRAPSTARSKPQASTRTPPSNRTSTRARALSREQARAASEINEDPQGRLRFDQGDQRDGRVGDTRDVSRQLDEFPPRRVREAGRSGGEVTSGEVTADDMAPETLLDLERSRTPSSSRGRTPLDTALSTLDDTIVGGGIGPDEAERAGREPVGKDAAEATRQRAQRHARDGNAVEPHEAEELAAAARARQRNSR